MSRNESPSHWSSGVEDRLLKDAAFTEDISVRMRVPKRITARGELSDDELHPAPPPSWTNHREKFDMNVPDRIMLLGQDQHLGTRAPPREITLENSVLGGTMGKRDEGTVRVQTPPRVLTLQQHAFPSADDPPRVAPPAPALQTGALVAVTANNHNDSRLAFRENTPPVEGSLSAGEEVVHLRRQVARINRRVMALELDSLQRQQRDRLAAALGLAYLVFKVIAWLNRS